MTKNIKKLTLKDVANRLDVSTATISNAFNRPDQLSANLRDNILTECEKMGYFGPNAAARSLRTGRTGIVGIVLSDDLSYSLTDPVANQFLTGMAEVFEAHEYNMLLLSSDEVEQDAQSRMQSSMVDGFIVYGHKPQQCINAPWLMPNKNIITVDSFIPGTTSVNIENHSGAYKIAHHALQHNPESVAILGLSLLATDRVCRVREGELFDRAASISIQRLYGYFEALAERNLTVTSENIWNIPENNHVLAYQAAREALSMANRPQLLLCMSDCIAIASVQAALHMGLQVPEDLHVVGFDGIAQSANIHPSITTIHQHTTEKGRVAAEVFLGLREAKNVILETELIVRESCPDVL
ncbi:LacI family DNA-binding transcriptional regulator [Marinomonas sp. IMCC 4694]|uniref:LacI family DNA-binding transcriptional regulator n=1 Tax=Marinomonas sp. IMCC 4694 TaxID=2605432 RepID=UPI0011E6E8A5|nr:LacI family DNA-binding transcriptional regulator [Marinomonas sp. IMCC 4694]TYL49207.1 LacI family DNA-binding transcriptional regulator [Marinomonas sp. IMCC 4694]